MTIWMEQFIRLIASDTGSLTYRLVLAFSIAISLYLTIDRETTEFSARRRRTLLGLSLLLVLQIGLFAVSALAWQNVVDGQVLLPPLDRAVSLISLTVLVWMWAFPDPIPSADAGAALLGLLIAAGSVAAAMWWAAQPPPQPYNGTPWDITASVFGAALAFLGIVILAARRPVGYAYGLMMLAIEGSGFILHLALLPYGEDYPSVLRMAQMIAYPLLALLPQRLIPTPDSNAEADAAALALAAPEGRLALVDTGPAARLAAPEMWNMLARMAGETDPDRMGREITLALTECFDADVCALMLPPQNRSSADPATGEMKVYAYNRAGRRFIESPHLDPRTLPVISSAWRMGRSRRLAASAQTPDLAGVAAALHLSAVSSLLFQPAPTSDGKPGPGILLISLNPEKDWDAAEQEFLTMLVRVMVQFLHRSQAMNALHEDLKAARQTSRRSQESVLQVQDERDRLASQIAVLRERAEHEKEQIVQLTAIAAVHARLQTTLNRMQGENDALQTATRQAEERRREALRLHEGEMRLALEELSLTHEALAQAEARITAYKLEQIDTSPDQPQFELIAAIGKELLQPLTSIGGYADILLGESQDTLGDKQRKYIQRIKNSTERMGGLIDELLLTTAPESNAGRMEFAPEDIRDVVRAAAAAVDSLFRMRRIFLRLDLPAAPLIAEIDRHALQRVVEALLENAARASPEGGEARLRALLEKGENEQDYVLVQVSDSGSGLRPEDILRVFTPVASAAEDSAPIGESGAGVNGRDAYDPIPGLGSRPGEMARVKALVEVIGGRIWIDSRPGSGALFTVLLPSRREDVHGQTAAPQSRPASEEAA